MIFKINHIAPKLLFGLALLITIISCQKGIKEKLSLKTNNNLVFFGFTLIDVGWDDPTDNSTITNYINEVKDFSNIADILVTSPSEDLTDRFQLMTDNNVQAILHLNEIFFENTGEGGNKSGFIYKLRSDYKDRWNSFVEVNKIIQNNNKIVAFYIGEEPAWNGISEADFTLASDYAKQTIPEIPILLIEAFAIVEEMYIPNSVDFVGFDHYFLKKPSENDAFNLELTILKSKMVSHQRIFLIMDTHWIKIAHGSSGIAKKDMDVIARDYYNMANSDTSIVGVLGYYWPNGFEFKNAFGARGLPKHVKEEYKRIGKMITGK